LLCSQRDMKTITPVGSMPDSPLSASSSGFDWPLANDAEAFLRDKIDAFLARNTFARRLAERMRDQTGTDFFEWVDQLVMAPEDEKGLQAAGFGQDATAETPSGEAVYEHSRATLPRALVHAGDRNRPEALALRPEFVADFIAAHNLRSQAEG